MAHKTLIGGTAYEISGGKTLVNGTAYSIDKGKTLVDGTAYEVGFLSLVPIGTALNDCTPEQIKAVAQAGQAANYWSVGDTVGIYLSGTFGGLRINDTYYAFIIGIDHNSSYEGSNTIHFQFGKTSGGTDVTFVYSYSTKETGFMMNTTATNVGGWASCYMRTTICPAFLSSMPTEWQSVIAACSKYTDNTGNKTNYPSSITETSDKIWLLAEFEVFGTQTKANSYEQNYQKQYAYYANGNSKIKYQHSDTTKTANWRLRSPWATRVDYFSYVATSGSSAGAYPQYSQGFSPCFMVA